MKSRIKRLWARRQFIVDWQFQADLMLRGVVFALFILVVLSVGIMYPLFRDLESDNPTFPDAPALLLYLHEHFWPVAILCLVLVILQTINLSHRIAGPMVRVKRTLRNIGDGKLPEAISLRPRDYMISEVDALNTMIMGLSGIVTDIKDAQASLLLRLEACAARSKTVQDPGMSEAISNMTEAAALLSAKIDVFRESHQPVELELEASRDTSGCSSESAATRAADLADSEATAQPADVDAASSGSS